MHNLNIDALTDDPEPRDTAGTVSALQYATRDHARAGQIVINGDQQWVKDGHATKYYGGPTLIRDVTITYGPWRRADRPDWRVIVFRYPQDGGPGRGWTWCWQHKGNPLDNWLSLPKARDNWREAYDEAMTAMRSRLADSQPA